MVKHRYKMTIERSGGDCARISLFLYTFLFWGSGFVLIFLGLWMLLDPKRNYVLDLVDFSEDDPLLVFASYISIVAGVFTVFVGIIGFCGALRRMRAVLTMFIVCLLVLFLADVGIGTLALVYRNKVHNENSTLATNLRLMVKFSYGISLEQENNRRITVAIDKMQFFEECCGSLSSDDYLGSRWMAAVSSDPVFDDVDPPIVPVSCCRQLQGSSALNPVAKSMARCQQDIPNKQWRHVTGCHEKLLHWFDEQTYIFAGIGFGFAALMVVGMIISILLCNSVRYYTRVQEDY